MADAVNTEVLFNGNKRYVVRFTNKSDGTGKLLLRKLIALLLLA